MREYIHGYPVDINLVSKGSKSSKGKFRSVISGDIAVRAGLASGRRLSLYAKSESEARKKADAFIKRTLRYPPVSSTSTSPRSATQESRNRASVQDNQLRQDLIALRTAFQRQLGWSEPFYVYPNETLDALVSAKPQTISELIAIKGIGSKRLNFFGDSIIQLCRRYHRPPTTPSRRPQSSQSKSPPRTPVRAPSTPRTPKRRKVTPPDDDADDVAIGPSMTVEDIVKERLKKAEAAAEVIDLC